VCTNLRRFFESIDPAAAAAAAARDPAELNE